MARFYTTTMPHFYYPKAVSHWKKIMGRFHYLKEEISIFCDFLNQPSDFTVSKYLFDAFDQKEIDILKSRGLIQSENNSLVVTDPVLDDEKFEQSKIELRVMKWIEKLNSRIKYVKKDKSKSEYTKEEAANLIDDYKHLRIISDAVERKDYSIFNVKKQALITINDKLGCFYQHFFNDYWEARKFYTRACDLLETIVYDSEDLAECLFCLGVVCSKLKDWSHATEYFLR